MFISKRIVNNYLEKTSNFILPRHRKTEPTLLWWTKVVVSIILSGGLIVYIYFLINLIVNDEPSIQSSTNKLGLQPYPGTVCYLIEM